MLCPKSVMVEAVMFMSDRNYSRGVCRVKGNHREMMQDLGARQAGALWPSLSLGTA